VTDKAGPCARCGRRVRLPGRRPEGRICSNCVAIDNRDHCGTCGDYRRVFGRDPNGIVWCERCARRHRAEVVDDRRRERIITEVARADPTMDTTVVAAALAATVRSRRSLGVLDRHLTGHPDVLTVGPTSTVAIVDRFVTALVDAGSARIVTVHPVCDRCGRRRRWHARTDAGGECSACWARTHREPCAECGRARRVDHREAGQPVCLPCVRHRRRQQQLDGLTADIAEVIVAADPGVDAVAVAAAVEAVAPKVPTRAALARQLHREPDLTASAHRIPKVAQLLDRLRAGGSSLPASQCQDCDGPAVPLIVYLDVVRCRRCAKRCPDCGRHGKEPHGTRCGRCQAGPRGTCSDCGRIDRLLDTNSRCRACREQIERRCEDCDNQAPRTFDHGRWLCQPCALAVDLDQHLGPVDDLPTPLVAVRAAIAAADNPTRVRHWLRTSNAGRVLAGLADGTMALTHEALDTHAPGDRGINYLRALLVASDALALEDRTIHRFEDFARALLDTIVAGPGDRTALTGWLRWQILPRLRHRAESGQSMAHSANNARRSFRQASLLITRLANRGRTLQTCRQADLDDWFSTGGDSVWQARPFLTWAKARGHVGTGVSIPTTPRRNPRPVLDDRKRWAIARQLVTDTTLNDADRVAGALLVLYGQPLSRIAAVTTGDIHPSSDGTTIVELAGHPMPLHEPFVTLIGQLPQRGTHGMSDQIHRTGWLFPGRQADRHISPNALGVRLRRIGIEARTMRNSARAQLATEIPPALLGEIIGVNATTATRWAALTAGNWTDYAAAIADDR
jgi:hypothetical protein